ncbi:MAG: hypothetical protein H7122_12290 [Chitinophagaceae bacterium]|nr:hypothetical protein [Chitinophagaceae bacterium]
MLNPTKQAIKSPLYVTQHSFSYEQMLQHCLWKILSETGLIHIEQLTEMEAAVISRVVKKKGSPANYSSSSEADDELKVLNVAIDKIICQIRNLQAQGQKYHSVIAENRTLKTGLKGLTNISEKASRNCLVQVNMDRSVSDIGLSKRTVRLLRSTGIDTLEQLKACSLPRLRNQSRVGVKTLHEIEAVLSSYSIENSFD